LPFFQAKARTAEKYIAGIGVSGALIGSASVLFVILIGLVTFNAWPLDGGPRRGGGGEVPVASNEASPVPAARRGPFTSTTRLAGAQPTGARGGGAADGNGGLPTGDGGSGSGLGGEAPAVQPAPAPSGPPQPRNAISRTVSDVGTTVEGSTDSLGDALGGSSGSAVGGVVGATGRAVNDGLQSLAVSP
jgi:hypothetical protein